MLAYKICKIRRCGCHWPKCLQLWRSNNKGSDIPGFPGRRGIWFWYARLDSLAQFYYYKCICLLLKSLNDRYLFYKENKRNYLDFQSHRNIFLENLYVAITYAKLSVWHVLFPLALVVSVASFTFSSTFLSFGRTSYLMHSATQLLPLYSTANNDLKERFNICFSLLVVGDWYHFVLCFVVFTATYFLWLLTIWSSEYNLTDISIVHWFNNYFSKHCCQKILIFFYMLLYDGVFLIFNLSRLYICSHHRAKPINTIILIHTSLV